MLVHPPSSLFSTYSPALARQILRRVRPSTLLTRFNASVTTSGPSAESSDGTAKNATKTLPQRPYTFHIGASWAGKPEYPTYGLKKVPFPSDSLIGLWRDQTLSRNSKPAGAPGTQALDPGRTSSLSRRYVCSHPWWFCSSVWHRRSMADWLAFNFQSRSSCRTDDAPGSDRLSCGK